MILQYSKYMYKKNANKLLLLYDFQIARETDGSTIEHHMVFVLFLISFTWIYRLKY